MSIAAGHQRLPLSAVYRSPVNPREITDDALERLKHTLRGRPDLLQARPMIATLEGEILAGNQRHRALEEMAAEGTLGPLLEAYPDGFPVFAGEFDAAGRREVMLLDNQPFGTWVDDKLAEIVAEHERAGGDLEMLGFGDAELRSLLELAQGPRAGGGHELGDPDEPIRVPYTPVSRLGDLYRLGDHRLVCGSCTDPGHLELLFGAATPGLYDETVDLIITDPPYGVAYQTKLSVKEAVTRRRRTDGLEVENDALTPEDTRDLFAQALALAPLKDGGSFYATVPAGPMQQWFVQAIDLGLPAGGSTPPALRQILTWVKDRFVMGRTDYHYRHEPILYGWKPGAAHYFVDDRTQDSVWEIPRPARSELHPTMKPSDLFRRMIVNSSREGEIVYDPFSGSGTAIVSCEVENRRGRGMELSPRYADAIVERWEKLTGDAAILVRDGEELPLPPLRLERGDAGEWVPEPVTVAG